MRPQTASRSRKDEPAIALVYERRNRLLSLGGGDGVGFDFISHLGGSLDNVETYLNLGATLRLGWNVPNDFGMSLIRPAGTTFAPVDVNDLRVSKKHGFSLYLFGGVDGRAVAWNIFLDGNTWKDSHSVDKKYYRGDAYAGVGLIIAPFTLSYTHVYRSREFDEQDDSQRFGSITLSVSF